MRFNPVTAQLEVVETNSSSGSVSGIPPTTYTAIARWADTTATTIENSLTLLQDGGGIEAQGFITRRSVTNHVDVNSGESWVAPSLIIEVGGSITIQPDAEIIVV